MGSSKKLRFSRWRRLPGLFRTGERVAPDVDSELRRLVLYVPWRLLDQAELLARETGSASIQRYCEALLGQAIDGELAGQKLRETETERGMPFEGLAAIASDPEYLREWSERASIARGEGMAREPVEDEIVVIPDEPGVLAGEGGLASIAGESETWRVEERAAETDAGSPASGVVIRHAALAGWEDFRSFLASLRRGDAPEASAVSELLGALGVLEEELAGSRTIDRMVAHALHRLAFEGQVLITDGWAGESVDIETVAGLRRVQELVDRILSGQDIRYDGTNHGGAS